MSKESTVTLNGEVVDQLITTHACSPKGRFYMTCPSYFSFLRSSSFLNVFLYIVYSLSLFIIHSALVVSVENYMPWCNKLKQLPYLQCKMAKQEIRYSCHDPGVILKRYGHIVHKEDISTYTPYVDSSIRGIPFGKKSNIHSLILMLTMIPTQYY